MDLTQESILSLLIAEGGQVKKCDLLAKFKASVDCVDPAAKERNRELFKTFVNNVAFVREVDGARCVVLKKNYMHLLREEGSHVGGSGGDGTRLTGEKAEDPGGAEEGAPAAPQAEAEGPDESSVVRLALQRSRSDHLKMKRTLNFDVNKEEQEKENGSRGGAAAPSNKSRPYALPLRMPPSATQVEIHKLKADELPEVSSVDTFKSKKRPSSVESGRAVKKASEESRVRSSLHPLEQAEHDWLVNCAAGHWNQVYGLLLNDCQRIEKKDFMSGFTVLHWAAKTGNGHMLTKFIDTSRKGGVEVDVNVKSHGGYTPLHIAALHSQEYVMGILVAEYGAKTSVRDNCGKRAHHYLHNDASPTVREMMGAPKAQQPAHIKVLQKDEPDPLPSLHSISRLFQPSTPGLKKKSQRSGLYSLGEEREEGDPGTYRPRTTSSASMY